MSAQVDTQITHRSLQTIEPEQLNPQLVRKLPLEFLKRQRAIPIILEQGRVAIAMADVLNVEAYDAIVAVLAQPCDCVECPASEIEHAISHCYYESRSGSEGVEKSSQTEISVDEENEVDNVFAQAKAEDLLNIASKAPVIKLVNKILFQAVQSRASDIHVEMYEDEARVRFRIDGVLHDIFSPPQGQISSLVSRLKIMANLNIAERRLPQDGQSRVKIGDELTDIRVSVIPTSGGERVVLRLLDKSCGRLGLERIGFHPDVLSRFRSLIGLPHGIILLTGPTGSGKTTTLYAALNELNCEEQNILTVEDPIEYQLPGVGQMQVKPKINLMFSNSLRHLLRQDPDVIMIGEIRDVETAEIAIQASLTGHLVLSTLHTNDSGSAITRLIDMGIEPYLISSSVVAVMAQRLLRVICPQCKEPFDPKANIDSLLGRNKEHTSAAEAKFYRGAGCKSCLETGYLGRTAISELLVIDDDIKKMILKQQGSNVIEEAAIKKGMLTLREDGIRRALAGETTLEEVCRVTRDSLRTEMENMNNVVS